MSMLSAQCDELRAMAESVGLAMPQAATLMMEAADTIWELRDSVHRERFEADKLREQGARLFDKTLELGTENANLRERITTQKQTIQSYRDESREWREVAERAQAENAKLRELVRDMWKDYKWATDDLEEPYSKQGEFADRMRELGIEVDE